MKRLQSLFLACADSEGSADISTTDMGPDV